MASAKYGLQNRTARSNGRADTSRATIPLEVTREMIIEVLAFVIVRGIYILFFEKDEGGKTS